VLRVVLGGIEDFCCPCLGEVVVVLRLEEIEERGREVGDVTEEDGKERLREYVAMI